MLLLSQHSMNEYLPFIFVHVVHSIYILYRVFNVNYEILNMKLRLNGSETFAKASMSYKHIPVSEKTVNCKQFCSKYQILLTSIYSYKKNLFDSSE